MMRLNLLISISVPADTEYGMNSLNVTVVSPAVVGSVAVSTVNRIGSVTAIATAEPSEKVIFIGWLGRKFLPLAMMSTELMVPAALTLADSSATIDSGPCGVSIRTLGGLQQYIQNHHLLSQLYEEFSLVV